MKLFGPLHLTLLLVIAALALTLPMLCRRGALSARAVCFALGSALAINEIVWWITRYSREGIHSGNLPLQLCDAAVWIAVLACLTRFAALAEFTWFAGMAGAGMALLTPDVAAPWPQWPAIYFFLAHGGVVISAVLLAFSGVMNFHPRSLWRPYRRNKPGSASVLDMVGPWPWYLVSGAGIGLALFWLLWLPVRPSDREAT
jgi:hypothetical integral membrane protein (TIGR02206 family)